MTIGDKNFTDITMKQYFLMIALELLGFESDERQEEEINGVMTQIGWKATYEDYTGKNGILIPNIMKAI